MSCTGRPFLMLVIVAVCVAAPTTAGASAQDSKSAPVAKELVQTLDAAKLDSMAAPDPSTPPNSTASRRPIPPPPVLSSPPSTFLVPSSWL